jgi:uncharacterized Zn finger protein
MFDLLFLQNHVPSEIYRRGLDYYQQQLVSRLYEKGQGRWQAVVSGSEDYRVRIQLDGNTVLKATCTCPYDGGICKHIVAALLAIGEEATAEIKDSPSTVPSAKRKGGAKNKTSEIAEALQQLSQDELQNLVQQYAAQSREFRNFLAIHLLSKDNR